MPFSIRSSYQSTTKHALERGTYLMQEDTMFDSARSKANLMRVFFSFASQEGNVSYRKVFGTWMSQNPSSPH